LSRIALLLLLILSVEGGAFAQSATDTSVKAAFIVKFGGYVGWPADAGGPLTLCVVGYDPFGPALDRAAAGQQVNGRPVQVRRLPRIEKDSACALAFVGGAPVQDVASALSSVSGKPVLTVTDSRLGPSRGMIHFQVDRSRVRFHIDEKRAAACGLTISSKLLALALSVRSRMSP
jgi:hypothetical protein